MEIPAGIMDPAYFVGRKELLAWINGFLDLDYTKVEEMSSGTFTLQYMVVMVVPPGFRTCMSKI